MKLQLNQIMNKEINSINMKWDCLLLLLIKCYYKPSKKLLNWEQKQNNME